MEAEAGETRSARRRPAALAWAPAGRRGRGCPPAWRCGLVLACASAAEATLANFHRAGAALRFDGADDYATVFPGFQLLSEWTIEAWVMPRDPVTVGSCIIGLQTLSSQNLLTLTSTSGRAWQVYYGLDEQPIPYNAWLGSGGQDGAYSASPHHVAITHTVINTFQSRLQIFLNGTLNAQWVADQTLIRQRPEPPLPMLLGACHVSSGSGHEGAGRGVLRKRLFAGHVDELRWWDRALPADAIAASWRWSGLPALWPSAPFAGETGVSAVAARAAALRAQYSLDVVAQRVHDGSSGGRRGWLGTQGSPADSPQYVDSPFRSQVLYGAVYFQMRERSSRLLSFESWIVKQDIGTLTSEIYNGLLLVRSPSRPELGTQLYAPGSTTALAAGAIVPGVALEVYANASASHVDFAVRPCPGTSRDPVLPAACAGEQLLEVSLRISPSRAPTAGPAHAVQLARRGAFLRLPRPSANATFELWLQLTQPLAHGATLLSVQERGAPVREALRLWLRPSLADAVLEVCLEGRAEPARLLVPGVATSEPQHLAVSLEHLAEPGGGWSYRLAVHRNCVPVLEASVPRPCWRLDSAELRQPTIGQRLLPDAPGARGAARPRSGDFAAARLAEVRLWDHARARAELCAAMGARLLGAERGLLAYAPVVAADAAAAGAQPLALARAFQAPAAAAAGLGAPGPAAAEVLCAADFAPCPDPARGVGFAVRPSFFPLPPEVLELVTVPSETLSCPLSARDPDNHADDQPPAQGAGPQGTVDTLRYEIVTVPDPVCGHVYAQGDAFRIPDLETARQYGLPLTTFVAAAGLPLRFVPFEGASLAQVGALQGACDTLLRYRAIDSEGVRSDYAATIHLSVRRPGVALTAAEASDPSAVGAGRLVRLVFSGNTSEAPLVPVVLNGSWGTAAPRRQWVDGGAALLLELGPDAGADLVPGTTRFEVQASAGLLLRGDNLSAPCGSVSPPLRGDFRNATCPPGEVLHFPTGACRACPPGTFWAAPAALAPAPHAAACRDCPPGHFSARAAALRCAPCGPGRYLPAGAADRTACLPAPPGAFVQESNASEAEPCLRGAVAEAAGREQCLACPRHADCLARGRAGSRALALPGHFRAADGSFRSCRAPGACPGGEACAAGAARPLLGCYPCGPGWTRGRAALWGAGGCSECPSLTWSLATAGLLLAAAAALPLCLAFLNIAAARQPACLHPYVLKIGLGHLLMMSSFVVISEEELQRGFGAAASALHLTMGVLFAWDGMMPLQAIPLDCLLERLHLPGVDRLWVQLGVWLLLPCGVAALLLAPALLAVLLHHVVRRHLLRAEAVAPESEGGQMGAVVPVWIPGTGEDAGDGPRDPTVVPEGWDVCWSEEHERHYYHCLETGLSTWHQPVHVPSPSRDQARPWSPWRSGRRGSRGSRGSGGAAKAAAQNLRRSGDPRAYRLLGVWRLPSAPHGLRERLAAFAEDSLGVALAAAILAYPPVLRHLLALPSCVDLDGTRRLLALPELACAGADYGRIAAAAWAAALLWGLGLPGLCVWLAWRHRRHLHAFRTRAQVGLVTAEYEPAYRFWEALVLLRRFALVAAMVLAPAAPLELRLVLLLGVGNFSAFMNNTYGPFDDLSGGVLDELESRGLQLFCATAAALLLGSLGLLPAEAAAGLAFLLLAVHVAFLAGLAWVCLRFVRRAVAESVVDAALPGVGGTSIGLQPQRHRCLGALLWALRERVFLRELQARQHQAQASYDAEANALVLRPGPAGAEVRDHEQLLVAFGLSSCLEHAVADCRVERLSVQILEYVVRQSFALGAGRLRCTDRVYSRLSHIRGAGVSSPRGPGQTQGAGPLFAPQTFALGMAAVDLQGALNTIAHYSREHLERSFFAFMLHKGVDNADYQLSPKARNLRKSLGAKQSNVVPVFSEDKTADSDDGEQSAGAGDIYDEDEMPGTVVEGIEGGPSPST